jgi:two-component system response regulator
VISRILLVEDNTSDEKLTRLAFKNCGVPNEIIIARDGAAALELLLGTGPHVAEEATLPRLILLDVRLPKIDGLEVLRRLRADERTKLVPIVILTSSNEEEDVLRCYRLGANAYMRKPVEFAAFASAAKTLARFWLVLNEPVPSLVARAPGAVA